METQQISLCLFILKHRETGELLSYCSMELDEYGNQCSKEFLGCDGIN